MNKTRALLLLNGQPPARQTLPPQFSDCFILSADGAYRWAKEYGIEPDVVLGDMDSIGSVEAPGGECIRFSSDKDQTDGELALDYLLRHGFQEIEIYGAAGRREDHEMANYGLLVQALRRGARARLVTDYTDVYLFREKFSFQLSLETLVSLVPFGGDAHIMDTEGLQYGIADKTLPVGTTLGISNVVKSSPITVDVAKGMVLFYVVKRNSET